MIGHLEAGVSLDVFLDDFPTVTRELAIGGLRQAERALRAELMGRPRANID